MSSPQVIALVARFVIAALLVIGGICSIVFGFRIYWKGHTTETKDDFDTDADVKNAKLKIKAKLQNVGSVLMLTAILWGFFGYEASPKYAQKGNDITVGSAKPYNISVEPVSVAHWQDDLREHDISENLVKALEMLGSTDKLKDIITIDGSPVKIRFANLFTNGDGVRFIHAAAYSPKKDNGVWVNLLYAPEIMSNKLTLSPRQISVDKKPEIKPNARDGM